MGVSLVQTELPQELMEDPRLQRRVYLRGGDPEFRFLYRDPDPILPVWYEQQIQLIRWGNQNKQSPLPRTGWTWRTTLEAGSWIHYHPEIVEIPASFAVEKGIWFPVRQGIHGLLVPDSLGGKVVYMIVQPVTRYFAVMTRSDRMPVLIGEEI